jgi:hypothetical protein
MHFQATGVVSDRSAANFACASSTPAKAALKVSFDIRKQILIR